MQEVLRDIFGDELGPPLTDDEIKIIEDHYNFKFPPDLAELLKIGIPSLFYDWHGVASGNKKAISRVDEALKNLIGGIIFDVEHNGYVNKRSDAGLPLEERINRVLQAYNDAPKMIPIFSHRFIPSFPCEAGNPIFSCHQTDIIIYGDNIIDYLYHEFGRGNSRIKDNKANGKVKEIPYWTRMLCA